MAAVKRCGSGWKEATMRNGCSEEVWQCLERSDYEEWLQRRDGDTYDI